MKYINAKLNRKLAALCIILSLAICAGSCVASYFMYRKSIYTSYNEFAYELGEICLSYVPGDKLLTYLETGVTDEDYDKMVESIYQIYKGSSLYENKSGIYICVPNAEELTITNIFDVRIVEYPDTSIFGIGVTDPMGIKNPENAIFVYQTGERSSDLFVHETKYGYNSSAMLPVYNSNGEIVALLVCDMPIPYVQNQLNKFMLILIFVTLIIVEAFIALFLGIVKKTMTDPLEKMVNEANNFTKSDIEPSSVLAKIEQPDEIGQLAQSIYLMETDIKEYVANLTAVTAEKERIGAELDVATHIQASMLPYVFPAFPDRSEFDIYATMTPAKEVGGDFYDFFMVDNRHLAIVMADVSGKGVPAALFMVIGKTLLKDHTQYHDDLGNVFTEVNNLLCEANSEGLFITAFEGILDLVTGEFRFVNAGHEMPFICHKGQGYEAYKTRPGFVLAGMEGMKYKGGVIQLEVGDKIFQYTDGVTEATDINNQLYGMDRLDAILNQCCEDTPQITLQKVKADVDAFVGEAPQFDDITMLSLEYKKKMDE